MYIYIYKLYIQCMVDGNCDVAKIDGMKIDRNERIDGKVNRLRHGWIHEWKIG